MKNKKTIKVCCAILIQDNKVLTTRRSERMPLPGKWEFPGGKIKPGEAEQTCIIREIKEELDLDIQPTHRLNISIWENEGAIIHLIPFIGHITGGELTLKEHDNHKWLKPEQLVDLDWAAADLPIVKEVMERLI